MTLPPHASIARWLTPWRRAPTSPDALPLGLARQDIDSLRALRASPHWPALIRALERLGEAQAAELASGLPHDRYLFTCGALHALRRAHSLADDLIVAATSAQDSADARTRRDAASRQRTAASFVNTPWFDAAGLGVASRR